MKDLAEWESTPPLVAGEGQSIQLINDVIIASMIPTTILTVFVTTIMTTIILVVVVMMVRLQANAGHPLPRPRRQVSFDSPPPTWII